MGVKRQRVPIQKIVTLLERIKLMQMDGLEEEETVIKSEINHEGVPRYSLATKSGILHLVLDHKVQSYLLKENLPYSSYNGM